MSKDMPLYDYQCSHCNAKQEEFALSQDYTIRVCRICGKLTSERLVSMPHVLRASHRDGIRRFDHLKRNLDQQRRTSHVRRKRAAKIFTQK